MHRLNEPMISLLLKALTISRCLGIRRRLLIEHCFFRDLVTGHNPGLGYGILGLDSAYGKAQLARRFTRLAHERASGELSCSENWFEKLSFAVLCSIPPSDVRFFWHPWRCILRPWCTRRTMR